MFSAKQLPALQIVVAKGKRALSWEDPEDPLKSNLPAVAAAAAAAVVLP